MIRQLGPPHIFFTKSVDELNMTYLIKSLKEKELKTIISYEDAIAITRTERIRLLNAHPIDVVQHLDALFRHHIATLKKAKSLGRYRVEDHFYRIEFQQRGSAHIHCIFWLVDENGNRPPKLHLNDTNNDQEFKNYFNSIVKASSEHTDLVNGELRYQLHKHTFSCFKTNKGIIKINANQGHGQKDGLVVGEPLEIVKCRHGFPKYPVPETTIIRRFSTDGTDGDEQKQARINLQKIKKFIIRQTHTQEKYCEFEKLNFNDFLQRLGLSYDQYVFALKAAVKHSAASLFV